MPSRFFFIILYIISIATFTMKKKLYSKFDKTEISELPQVSFPGRIITIISPGEADKAVDYLLSMNILGVDTETKPAFHRGEHHQVALLQVSTHDTCFLFRLNRIGITPSIKRLLEDKTVKKIGLSWHDDIHMLQDRETFTPGLFIDLQDLVPQLGIKDLSLQSSMPIFSMRRSPNDKDSLIGNRRSLMISKSSMQLLMLGLASCFMRKWRG